MMRKILDTVYTAGCAAAALSLACLALIVLGQVMLNLLNAASAAFLVSAPVGLFLPMPRFPATPSDSRHSFPWVSVFARLCTFVLPCWKVA